MAHEEAQSQKRHQIQFPIPFLHCLRRPHRGMYLLAAPKFGAHILQAIQLQSKSPNFTLPRLIRNKIGLGVSRDKMGLGLSRAKKDDAGCQQEPDLFLLVGLGNPGPRYANTRHNVGFMTIDTLGQQTGILTDRLQANCQVGRGRLFDHKILLVKPITFMNVSGEGIGKLSRYYGVPPERIVVIYDDLDSPSGTVRLRGKGGAGGHNGENFFLVFCFKIVLNCRCH